MNKGDIVKVKGEAGFFKVLECKDERGETPRVLLEALVNMIIRPTYRVNREDIFTDEQTFRFEAVKSNLKIRD